MCCACGGGARGTDLQGAFTLTGNSISGCLVTYDVKMKIQGEPESAWATIPSWATMSSGSSGG